MWYNKRGDIYKKNKKKRSSPCEALAQLQLLWTRTYVRPRRYLFFGPSYIRSIEQMFDKKSLDNTWLLVYNYGIRGNVFLYKKRYTKKDRFALSCFWSTLFLIASVNYYSLVCTLTNSYFSIFVISSYNITIIDYVISYWQVF